MPQLTFPVTKSGLAVPVWIGLDGKTIIDLLNLGKPIPPPVSAWGLLDTGSDVTCVAQGVLQKLGVPPAAIKTTQTANGLIPVRLFEVSLSITDPTKPASFTLTQSNLLVIELTTILPDADVLIGLDILLECKLLLDGPGRQFTLDF